VISRSVVPLTVLALLALALLFPTVEVAHAETVVATVAVGTDPQGIDVNSATNRIYVANRGSNNVSVIDGNTNSVIATTAVGTNPQGVAVNPSTNRIYVANQGSGTLSVIDGGSNAVVATIQIGGHPLDVAVNPTTNRVYVGNPDTNTVAVIDGASNTVTTTIPFASGPAGIGVNPATNRVYVITTGASGVLSVIDGASNTVITTLPSGSNSAKVAVNPTTNRFYVTNTMIGNVSVFDGASNTLITTIGLGQPPIGTFGVAVNPNTNRVYVTSFVPESNNLSIIDGATNTVVATLPNVGGGADVAANSATNRVYAVAPTGNSVTVVQDQAPPLPPPSPVVSTWFFAEGSTQPPFDTWFLVENPTPQTATVTFTFFLQPSGAIARSFAVGPTSRFSLFANQVIPNVAFSTRIDSNVPVFAERAMYVSYDGDAVVGIPAPNKLWLFAEGATVQPFHTWLLLQNPNNVPAATTITYLLENGQTVTQTLVLPPISRTSIFVNEVLPNAAFSSRIESDQPIIVERAMYRFPGNAATAKSGVNAPSKSWFFAEGRTSFRGLNADTFLLMQNPNTTSATATITLYNTSGQTLTFPVSLLPTSRLTLYVNPIFSGSFGIKVTSDIPIIVERSVFFGNDPLLGAYSTQGTTALATSWHFAEGETRAPFDELITILNPQSTAMGAHIDFELENGQVIGRDFAVAPNSKLEIPVDNILTGANSASVRTTLPSVVERIMYIFKRSIGATDSTGFPGS